MAPVPIALCGKNPNMASSFQQSMLPEYEIVHHFQSTSAVHRELAPLLKGQPFKSESVIGSQDEQNGPSKVPRAIVVGAGFSRPELDDMRTAEGGDSIPWLFPDPLKTSLTPLAGPFILSVITRRAKGSLRANGVEEGSEPESRNAVWGF